MTPTKRTVPELLRADAELYERKAADYASSANPWENFRSAARFAGRLAGKELDERDACALLIGVKISRLETLGRREPANEGVADTLRDLRVYAAILESMLSA